MKTCTYHIKTSKKEMQNSIERKKIKNKNKINKNKINTRSNLVLKRHWVRLAKNFDLNQMSACGHENL